MTAYVGENDEFPLNFLHLFTKPIMQSLFAIEKQSKAVEKWAKFVINIEKIIAQR